MDWDSNSWASDWQNNNTNVTVQAPPLSASPTYTATASANWFTESDTNNDGLPDN